MKKINAGDVITLLMEVKSPDTPFFAKIGDSFVVSDITIDPYMPSGHAVRLVTYGSSKGAILVDRSAVVHIDDWKNIYNAVIKTALSEAIM